MATVAELIAKIDLKIAALLDDSGNVGNYHIGDKRVDSGAYLKILTDARENLLKQGSKEPFEDISSVAYDIDEFGVDRSEYIGDAIG